MGNKISTSYFPLADKTHKENVEQLVQQNQELETIIRNKISDMQTIKIYNGRTILKDKPSLFCNLKDSKNSKNRVKIQSLDTFLKECGTNSIPIKNHTQILDNKCDIIDYRHLPKSCILAEPLIKMYLDRDSSTIVREYMGAQSSFAFCAYPISINKISVSAFVITSLDDSAATKPFTVNNLENSLTTIWPTCWRFLTCTNGYETQWISLPYVFFDQNQYSGPIYDFMTDLFINKFRHCLQYAFPNFHWTLDSFHWEPNSAVNLFKLGNHLTIVLF